MAADESLFVSTIKNASSPVFRFYTWALSSITIGYFQKYSDFTARPLPIVRRLTGGLLVEHGKDISYCFVASRRDWPFVDDQEKNYEAIHFVISQALNDLNFKCSFISGSAGRSPDSLCVNNLFPHDLILQGRKIVGSCQRKRGNTLLVQGSIHLHELSENIAVFTDRFAANFQKKHGFELFNDRMNDSETALAKELSATKYSHKEWNQKI